MLALNSVGVPDVWIPKSVNMEFITILKVLPTEEKLCMS